jgi:hypothetical protein
LSEPAGVHPIGTPTAGISPHTGPIAAASWLAAREIVPPTPSWSAEIIFPSAEHLTDLDFDENVHTLFKLDIFAEEWGFKFCYRGRLSWIRVTDIRFVHGRDDHELLPVTPPLRNIGSLLAQIETRYDIAFPRTHADVVTTIPGAEDAIRAWASSL